MSKADASISCDATANASDAAADLHGPVVPVGEATAATLAPERSFGQKAASGMTWLALQTIGYKIISFFGQVLLTYMIVPEDSAQINLALGVAAFTNFLQQPGLREVLVQRRSRSARWDEIGLWFSVSLGIVAALLTIAAGPIAAWWFQSPNVAYLLFILALAAPLTGLGTVPEARLQCEMRFKLLSMVEFFRATALLAITIGLASLGWGAYAFAVPVPLMAAVRAILLWRAARPPFSWRLHVRRWKFLLTDSTVLFTASMVTLVITQGSLFVLARVAGDNESGLYSFGYNLSLTTFALLANNIGNVMFPMLSAMQDDPERLRASFLRSARLLNLLGIPACLLQGALAEPFIRVACSDKWAGSVPVLQLLSIAMAMVILWPSSRALVQAQGRYTLNLVVICIDAVVFLGCVVTAGWLWKTGAAVSCAVIIAFTFTGIFNPWVATRPLGAKFSDVLRPILLPMFVGWAGIGSAYAIAHFAIRPMLSMDLKSLLVVEGAATTVLSAILWPLILRAVAPADFAELMGFAARITNKLRGRR